MSEQPSMPRLIAQELQAALRSLPMLLLILGTLDYRLVRNDGWPWWLPIVLTLAAVASGWFLGWRKAHKQRAKEAGK